MAEVAVVMTAQEASLWRAQQKLIAQTKALETGYTKVGRSGQRSGKQATAAAQAQGRAIASVRSNLMGLVGTYASVAGGIALVTRALQEQRDIGREAMQVQRELAKAQQEAIKNLTGLTTKEKQGVLGRAVLRIQSATGFPDQSVLTEAIGAGFSASGDLPRTLSAAEAAARLTPLTPEQTGVITSGSLDVAKATGLVDAERNIGLMLSAGAEARIEDPGRLAATLAPALASGVATVPAQDKVEASKEVAAMFTTLSRQASDRIGKVTMQATFDLTAELENFFKDRKDIEDPGTIRGRVQAIRSDEKLHGEFLSKEFGQSRFRKGMELLLTAESDVANEFDRARQAITADANLFREEVQELRTMTPALITSMTQVRAEANRQILNLGEDIGRESTAIENAQALLRQTRPRGEPFAFVGEAIYTTMALMGAGGEDPETRARSLLLQRRRMLLGKDIGARAVTEQDMQGLDEQTTAKVQAIERGIENLQIQRQMFSERAKKEEVMQQPAAVSGSPDLSMSFPNASQSINPAGLNRAAESMAESSRQSAAAAQQMVQAAKQMMRPNPQPPPRPESLSNLQRRQAAVPA